MLKINCLDCGKELIIDLNKSHQKLCKNCWLKFDKSKQNESKISWFPGLEDGKTCIYFHINPIKQEIFYVGIGSNNRAYDTDGRNNFWRKVVSKYGYEVIIIEKNLKWFDACNKEIEYIKQIGRRDLKLGTLVNLTDGGDAINGTINKGGRKAGFKMSEETKLKIKIANTGKKMSEENRLKVVERMKTLNIGRKRSDEFKQKVREKMIGKKFPFKKRSPMSQETKDKIGDIHRGRVFSEEHKEILRNINVGRKINEEIKVKMRTSQRIRRENEKLQQLEILRNSKTVIKE